MKKNLPVYELVINPDEDSFVDAVALVEQPAIESNFLAFSKEQLNLTFTTDDEEMTVLGAAMIPDQLIYRIDPNRKEYNVFFSKDTIKQIAQTFFKKGFQKNMNLDHTKTPAKSYIFQSYIVDESKGMAAPKNLNIPDGSWVVAAKVEDPTVWKEIKAGKQKGFSVEGVFEMIENKSEQNIDEEMMKALKLLNSLINKKKK